MCKLYYIQYTCLHTKDIELARCKPMSTAPMQPKYQTQHQRQRHRASPLSSSSSSSSTTSSFSAGYNTTALRTRKPRLSTPAAPPPTPPAGFFANTFTGLSDPLRAVPLPVLLAVPRSLGAADASWGGCETGVEMVALPTLRGARGGGACEACRVRDRDRGRRRGGGVGVGLKMDGDGEEGEPEKAKEREKERKGEDTGVVRGHDLAGPARRKWNAEDMAGEKRVREREQSVASSRGRSESWGKGADVLWS